jgi:hypothetical protein
MNSHRENLLAKASKIVAGDRQDDYGDPSDNYKTVAAMWSVYLEKTRKHRDTDCPPVLPHDVAIMMVLLKTVRIAHQGGHADSWVDLAGYAACGWETLAEINEKGTEKGAPAEPESSILISELERRDIHLSVSGDRLGVDAPEGALDSELLSLLREQKPALLRQLRRRSHLRPDQEAGCEPAADSPVPGVNAFCGNCAYREGYRFERSGSGTCRLNPPVPGARWPTIRDKDWCGQWRPKVDQEKEDV